MRALDTKEILLATHNEGKLREIRQLMAPYGFTVTSAADHNLPEPPEAGTTFDENAYTKAYAAASATGSVALSDDSGLCVDALGGAPGVYTADWAETPNGRDFPLAMTRAWKELEQIKAPTPRTCRFCCTLCLAWPDGHDEIFEGTVEGEFSWPMRGELGFGFDPVFNPLGKTETFGQMEPLKKHGMSHRADAFRKLVAGCLA